MGNIELWHTSNDWGTTYKYSVEGFLSVRERKNQSSLDLPFPLLEDNDMIINSIFGQKRIFDCSFIIMVRADDYTLGTGSPSDYSAYEQRTYLFDTIFKAAGYHTLKDEEGNSFTGRIENMEIVRSGDDPIKFDVVFTFKRGLVPVAGQFSPF